MEGKKSVIIYADWIATVSRMPIEDRGYLLTLILEYINDKEPDEEKYGLLVSVAFGGIKQQMKRDLVKWKKTLEQRSGAGKASAEAKRIKKEVNEIQRDSTPVDSVQRTSTKSTVSVNVNVNEKEEKGIPSLGEVIDFFDSKGYDSIYASKVFEWYQYRNWEVNGESILKKWRFQMINQWMKSDEGKKSDKPKFKNLAEFIEAQNGMDTP